MTRFNHEIRYSAGPADVAAMLADPAFRERVCEAQDTLAHDVKVTQNGDSMTVVIDQTRTPEGIPSFATKFVGDKIHILQKEHWSDATGAELDVTIPGKPGHVRGSVALEPDGEGTIERVEAEVKVSIPLVGGKLEKLIADLLQDALRKEQKVGEAWLGS